MSKGMKAIAIKEAAKRFMNDDMDIIDQGYYANNGQLIDLVAKDPWGDIIFALVRVYDHARELPEPTIAPDDRQRFESSAMEWLEHHPALTAIHFSFDLFDFNIIGPQRAIIRRHNNALN